MTIVIGDRIADEALEWQGTPMVWLGRVKGVGCDCKGLVAGVAAACGRPEAASVEALANDYRGGDARRLLAGLERLFDRAQGAVRRGDVLLLMAAGKAQHLAIVTAVENGRASRIVHVHGGLRRVRDVPMHLGDIIVHSAWRWREAGEGAHG